MSKLTKLNEALDSRLVTEKKRRRKKRGGRRGAAGIRINGGCVGNDRAKKNTPRHIPEPSTVAPNRRRPEMGPPRREGIPAEDGGGRGGNGGIKGAPDRDPGEARLDHPLHLDSGVDLGIGHGNCLVLAGTSPGIQVEKGVRV